VNRERGNFTSAATRTSVIKGKQGFTANGSEEPEEALPGSRFLALSEQRANKPTGEKKGKIKIL
jgi:hypothetical protein